MENEQIVPICPNCSGPMAKRKSTTGEFYGCRNYPTCKGTLNIGQESKEKPGEDTKRVEVPPKPAGQLILDSLKRIEENQEKIIKAVTEI